MKSIKMFAFIFFSTFFVSLSGYNDDDNGKTEYKGTTSDGSSLTVTIYTNKDFDPNDDEAQVNGGTKFGVWSAADRNGTCWHNDDGLDYFHFHWYYDDNGKKVYKYHDPQTGDWITMTPN